MNLQIIQAVAQKEDVSQELIDKIERSMFLMIKETVEEGKFQGIMLPLFGKFVVKPYNQVKYANVRSPKERIEERKVKANLRRLSKLDADNLGTTKESQEDAGGKTEDMSNMSSQ